MQPGVMVLLSYTLRAPAFSHSLADFESRRLIMALPIHRTSSGSKNFERRVSRTAGETEPVRGPAEAGHVSLPTVRLFRTVNEIEGLRTFWSSWRGCRDSDLDLVLAICRSTPGIAHPIALVVYRAEQPSAGLLGWIEKRPVPFRVGFFNLISPTLDVLTFSQGAFRGEESRESCDLLSREALKTLQSGEGDLVLFDHLGTESAMLQSLRRASGPLSREWFSSIRPHWVRKIPDSLEQLRASFSVSERKRFRQIAKKLSADFQGRVELTRCDAPSQMEETLVDVEHIAARTWQREISRGYNTDPSHADYLRVEAELGYLRVYVLHLAGRPCAFWIGAVHRQTFYTDFVGYDPEYARYSVGTYLLSRVLEQACSEGVQVFDFGFTDDEYKRRFGNLMKPETSLHIFAPGLQGAALNFMRMCTVTLNGVVKALLECAKLTQLAKTWRRRASRNNHDQSVRTALN